MRRLRSEPRSRVAWLLGAMVIVVACNQGPANKGSVADGGVDASTQDVAGEEGAPPIDPCSLPGSVVWKGGVPSVVPGGGTLPDATWLHLPDGFCAHYFGTLPEVRQLRFAPNGDLFAASPSRSCLDGVSGGLAAIAVLPDDDHDGVADGVVHYKDQLPSTQGLLFYNGYLYYQDDTKIMRVAYSSGDRAAPPAAQQMMDVNVYVSSGHWPKALDVDDSGNIFVTNGGDMSDVCDPAVPEAQRPFHGGILRIDGSANGALVTKGTRNPIAIRCAKGTGACFGLELARDLAGPQGSREKLFPVRQGDDWGYPCCATAGAPYTDITPAPDCASVAAETTSFVIDHTPFGLDFEQGNWPGTWRSRTYVVLHGFTCTWTGARVVGIQTDARGWPVPSSEANPGTAILDFATGWDDGMHDHGRPTAVAFAPDGRLFVGNDVDGSIYWFAPSASPAGDP